MQKILITGASGFLGSVITRILTEMHYNISTIGISKTDDIHCDLSKSIPIIKSDFDWIIHIAGKAHVMPKNSNEIADFFKVNFEGTKNLIKGVEQSFKRPQSIIFISTVAVYGVESGTNINEDHPLQGRSPYALSKIKAEKFLKEWCSKNDTVLGILRPPLIAGKNPPGNLGAMIKGVESKKYFRIDKGSARKSILMADDIARLIPRLAEVGGIYNVCDNVHPSFAELDILIANQLNKRPPKSIPYLIAKCLAIFGDLLGSNFPINSTKLDKLTKSLTFSNEKAKRDLNWEPLNVLQNFKIH